MSTQFQPGQSGNPKGRPKGSRNKLGEEFLNDLLEDWKEHGKVALQKCREESPAIYVKTIASILPKELEISSTDRFDEMSDEELKNYSNKITLEELLRSDDLRGFLKENGVEVRITSDTAGAMVADGEIPPGPLN